MTALPCAASHCPRERKVPASSVRLRLLFLLIAAAAATSTSESIAWAESPFWMQCGASPVRGTIDNGIPAPSRFSNRSNHDAVFTITMRDNSILGPSQDVFQTFLPAGTGGLYSEGLMLMVDPSTEPGTGQLCLDLNVDIAESNPVQTCCYPFTLDMPDAMENLILVPIRPCVLEGTADAADASPGTTVDATRLLKSLIGSNDLWLSSAHVFFYNQANPGEIPVIAGTEGEMPGVISDGFHSGGIEGAGEQCEHAWLARYGSVPGLPVLEASRYYGSGTAEGVSIKANDSLLAGADRWDDLCSQPRHLKVSDVTAEYASVMDPAADCRDYGYCTSKHSFHNLAHELGHALLLGHGNGVDDNEDGFSPFGSGFSLDDNPGLRRYDEYCDILQDTHEDDASINGLSIMTRTDRGVDLIRPLQIEQARAAAKLYPGALTGADDPAGRLLREPCDTPLCGLPADISITNVELDETPGSAITEVVVTVASPIGDDLRNRYLGFVDLDDDGTTGCSAAALGLPSEMQGIELATELALSPHAAPKGTIWTCQNGSWAVRVNGSTSVASVSNLSSALGPEAGRAIITMPDSIRGPMAARVRIQGVAGQLDREHTLDRVPADPAIGGEIDMVPPPIPTCTVRPVIVQPGASLTLSASHLSFGTAVPVSIGDLAMGSVLPDSQGKVQSSIQVPPATPAGLQMISMQPPNAPATVCPVLVKGSPLLPASTASVDPEDNGSGWWKDPIVWVTLKAVAGQSGAISNITYSEYGAQVLSPTPISGSTALVPFVHEGATTLSYQAIDVAGNREPTKTLTVRIDRAPPSISGSLFPAPNPAGWINQDATVQFHCSDARSGVLSCPPAATLSTEGVGLFTSGTAYDLAGNTASATIGGINIDKTPPRVSYLNDQSSYTVDLDVNIACAASDTLSGLASNGCSDIQGAAWSFGAGHHTFSASATDRAGNEGTGTASFDVLVSFDSLCHLTHQFAPDLAADGLCVSLDAAQAAAQIGWHTTGSNGP